MPSFTSFNASNHSSPEVARILHDYLALDRARIWRRLIVVRFGVLALTVFVLGRVIPGLSAYAFWVPVLLFVTPAMWAAIAEVRLSLRLSHRLRRSCEGGICTVVSDSGRSGTPREKVIKSP